MKVVLYFNYFFVFGYFNENFDYKLINIRWVVKCEVKN